METLETVHEGPMGTPQKVNGIFYFLDGWNQLPLRLLRKSWVVQGPRGSHRLSERSRFLLKTIQGMDGGKPGLRRARGQLSQSPCLRGSASLALGLRSAQLDLSESPKGFDANSACLCVLTS